LVTVVLLHTIFGQADKWDTLRAHITDGQLAIDNYRVENSLRAIALSRKNYFFAGDYEATRYAAVKPSI
jgi:hypothetical protein